MLAYILNTGQELIAVNVDADQKDNFEQRNSGNFREFTVEEYDSVGAENIKYVSQKTTQISGTTTQDATITYTAPVPAQEDYTTLRERGYPSIGDQLDMLWHSMESGETTKAVEFFDALQLVKDTYPKPA